MTAALHSNFNNHTCIELYRDHKFVRYIPMEASGLIINKAKIAVFDRTYSPMENYSGGVKRAAKIYLKSTIKVAFRAKAALKLAIRTGAVDEAKLKGIANTFTNEVVVTPTTKNRTAAPKKDCGDDIASKLRGMDLAEVYAFAADKLGDSVKALEAKYSHLNPGMQRMNLGNRLRKVMK